MRELAPYVGFVWERKVGRTSDLARRRGEDFDIPAFVAGGPLLVLANCTPIASTLFSSP